MAGGRRARGVTPRPLASFDADVPPPPPKVPAPAETPPPAPAPRLLRLEASSIRSLEARRNRWIRERLARERRQAAAIEGTDPPP